MKLRKGTVNRVGNELWLAGNMALMSYFLWLTSQGLWTEEALVQGCYEFVGFNLILGFFQAALTDWLE